tara:strand:+ start:57491 stop:58126 length:636 start_codon:yes stop_codon:yes gene_type:complete
MSKDKYQETFETWNKIAGMYEEKFMHLDIYNQAYDAFLNRLNNSNPTILEIGCGPGNISKYLLSNKEMQLLGLDISSNMVALAQKNNPTAEFKVFDARNLHSIKGTFNAIVCGFTMPYLSHNDCMKFFTDCYNVLHHSGILFLSFVDGDYNQSGYINGSTGDRAYFYYHNQTTIINELKKQLFVVLDTIVVDYNKSEGVIEKHVTLILEKE